MGDQLTRKQELLQSEKLFLQVEKGKLLISQLHGITDRQEDLVVDGLASIGETKASDLLIVVQEGDSSQSLDDDSDLGEGELPQKIAQLKQEIEELRSTKTERAKIVESSGCKSLVYIRAPRNKCR